MSRYIDVDALMQSLQKYRPEIVDGQFNGLQIRANQVLDCVEYEIDNVPSIDIVRCCECYYFDNDSCYCTIFRGFMDDLGFCYVGDRKTKKDERRVYVKGVDDEISWSH